MKDGGTQLDDAKADAACNDRSRSIRFDSTELSNDCKQGSGCNLIEHVDGPRSRASGARRDTRWLEPEDPPSSTVDVESGGADGVGAEKSVQKPE